MIVNKIYRVRDNDNFFLTIAATDPTGEAGVTKDCKVASYFGFNTLSVVTAVTVQNDDGLTRIEPVGEKCLEEQLLAIEKYPVKAVKIGALGSIENAYVIANALSRFKDSIIVWDPVFAPTNGIPFIAKERAQEVAEKFFSVIDIMTPNIPEIKILTSKDGDTGVHFLTVAELVAKKHDIAIYIKGGHSDSDDTGQKVRIREYLITRKAIDIIDKENLDFPYKHGTGCTFSTALACLYYLNKGNLSRASINASDFVAKAYRK